MKKNIIATTIYLIFFLAVLIAEMVSTSAKVVLIFIGVLILYGYTYLNKTHSRHF